MTTVGALIRELRLTRNISLNCLADRAAVAKSTLSRWEAGANQPRLPELEAVLTALGASPAEHERAIALIDAPRAVRRLRAGLSPLFEGEAAHPTLGDLLRAMRRRKSFTLAQIALRLGVSARTVAGWEAGRMRPEAERLEKLLDLLGAAPEERAAVTSGHLLLAPPPLHHPSPAEAIEQQLDLLGHKISRSNSVLLDLAFLSIEAQLRSLARQRPSIRRLLARAYSQHAKWLSASWRLAEAGRYAEGALELVRQGFTPETRWWVEAVGTAAHSAVYAKRRPHAAPALEILQLWLPEERVPAVESRLYRDMAEYAAMDRQFEAAAAFIVRAHQGAERAESRHEMRLARHIQAGIFMRMGRPQAAVSLLPADPPPTPFLQIHEGLLWAHILLGVGDIAAAHDQLSRAYAMIDTFGYEQFRGSADQIVRTL